MNVLSGEEGWIESMYKYLNSVNVIITVETIGFLSTFLKLLRKFV